MIHVSGEYKIQFCCQTHLHGEWPRNAMVERKNCQLQSPQMKSLNPLLLTNLQRIPDQARITGAITDYGGHQSALLGQDAPLKECQGALNFFHCASCG